MSWPASVGKCCLEELFAGMLLAMLYYTPRAGMMAFLAVLCYTPRVGMAVLQIRVSTYALSEMLLSLIALVRQCLH